jgi:Uma2 family endonuclease
MTAMTTTLPLRPDGWTVEDLELLPDDDLRYELVDGALLVTPPPLAVHNLVANELSYLLHDLLPREWVAIAPGSIEFDMRNWRMPDLVVATRECMRRKYPRPGEVLLAVEVMSPNSRSTDRLVKPAQYAAAGIPHFWRFEQSEPLLLLTHVLDGDVYRETGRYTDVVAVDDPVPLRFRLADLLP